MQIIFNQSINLLKSTEILVVGHGLAGSLMAWELQQAGMDYKVMNAPLIHRSSDVAGGLFNPLMFRKLRLSRMVRELWPVMQTTYEAIEKHFGTKLLHHVLSAKMLYDNEISEWEQGKEKNTGLYIQALKRDLAIQGLRKVPALGLIASSGYLDIGKWLEISKRDLVDKEKFIEEALVYEDLTVSKDKILINNLIEARKIIFCEGAAAMNNPWFKGEWLTPNKGELLEIHAPGLEETYILRDDVFILPLGQQRFKVGATYSHSPINTMPSAQGRNELQAKLEKMIAVPYEITKQYAGVRPAIKDRMPVLGAHPTQGNMFILNGLGSRGVVLAPYCAKALVKSLLFNNELIPDFLNISRFAALPLKTTENLDFF